MRMRTRFGRLVWGALAGVLLATAWAGEDDDLDRMSPTVQVICYRRTRTDQILPMSFGSGSVISAAGHVLTNCHVVVDPEEQEPYEAFEIAITVDIHRRPVRRFTARLAAWDRSLDLAILRLNPTDAMGRDLPRLKHVDWTANVSPKQGQSIQVLGYPASGGETLTVSRGQISGFERMNEYPCFKTDTDIDHGSSGGTVLDSRGRFIGVPAFLRSFAENVGYVLDIRAARPWISAHLADEPAVDFPAEARLATELAAFVRANDERTYRTELYPRLEVRLPEGWQFEEMSEDGFSVAQASAVDPTGVGFHFDRRPFPIDAGFKARLQEDIERGRETYDEFAQENTLFAGADAWRITFTSGRQTCILLHVFFGNTVLHVMYTLDGKAREQQQSAIQGVLDGVRFLEAPGSPPPPPQREFAFRDPDATVVLPEGWGGRLNPGSAPVENLLSAWQQGNCDGELLLSYQRVPAAKQQAPPAERLREAVKGTAAERIVRKQEDLIVDGLPGWLLVAEQNGTELKDLRRRLQAVVRHGEYEFVLEYGDTALNFERNADAITRVLSTLQVRSGDCPERGRYQVGALTTTFSDIRNHRFEEAIAALASRDLLRAYAGDRFEPEAPVTRAKALRVAIDSRNQRMKLTRPSHLIPLPASGAEEASGFTDIPAGHWLVPYARAARERGLVPLAQPDRFEPERAVPLADGLALLFAVYEVPVWSGTVSPSWKPVLDKGYELDLIPRGVEDPQRALTNAEMAGLVDALSMYMEAE